MLNDGTQVRLGVDIGGTFTDVAMEIGSTLHSIKVLTTYAAPEQAILEGIQRVVSDAGIGIEAIDLIIHGTTLATNSLIERRGAKTAFLTTRGFRDVIEMRTENRFEQYDLNIVLPPPLIARDRRFVVAGRLAASGRELEALDEPAIAAIARRLKDEGFESVAIGFIHSYVDARHEKRLARSSGRLLLRSASPYRRKFRRRCANSSGSTPSARTPSSSR